MSEQAVYQARNMLNAPEIKAAITRRSEQRGDNAEISADDEQWMREAIAYGAADAE